MFVGDAMKTAIIKHAYWPFGPWEFVPGSAEPLRWLERCVAKPTMWETWAALGADWYVTHPQITGNWTRKLERLVKGLGGIVEQYARPVLLKDVPLDDYDLVITLDPLLPEGTKTSATCVWIACEDNELARFEALKQTRKPYACYLDHMMDAPRELGGPAVAFPYMRFMAMMRAWFRDKPIRDGIWLDWRMVSKDEDAIQWSIQLGVMVYWAGQIFKRAPYGVSNSFERGDAVDFFLSMAHRDYFAAVTRTVGAGQALAEAASMGLICFGRKGRPYHNMICHPECLCDGAGDLPARFKRVRASEDLQEEIKAHQDAVLMREFYVRPTTILQELAIGN